MNLHSFYTNKGRSLAAKIAAGTAEMTVSRVVAGSGHTADIPSATDLPDQKQTLSVGLPAVSGATATLPVTLLEAQATSDYALTELGIYALDGDEGEILFQVCQLTEAESITALGEGTLRFYLRQTIGAEGMTVTCSPAGIVLEADIAELRAKAAYADHSNLLDNPWFTVNQRGQNSYTPPDDENIYCVDRFVTSEGALTISDTGVIMDARGYLVQILENHLVDSLQGKPVTLSVMSADGEVYSTSIASFDKNEEHKEFGAEFEISYVHWNDIPSFLIRNQDYLNQKTVRAVKLELGSVSTLANDTAPNYAEELAKCQRYYYQSWHGSVSEMTSNGACGFVAGHIASNPEAISFPVEMRTTPSIILYHPITHNSGEIDKWSDDTSVSAVVRYCNNARGAISGSTDNLERGVIYGYHYTATADL